MIDQVVWRNPVEFFAQSGRLILDDLAEADLAATFEGSACCAVSGACGCGTPTAACCTSPTAPTSTRRTTSTGSPRSSSATRRGCASGSTCRCSASACGSPRRRSPTRRAARPAAPTQLRAAVGLEVVTLNGFPYKAFHAPVVKRDVYWPHWAQDDAARLHARAGAAAGRAAARRRRGGLASRRCRSAGARAGTPRARPRRCARWPISRSSWRRSRRATGKRIRLALEPEPGCTVETIAQACDALGGLAPDWIGVCLDACHLAVAVRGRPRRRSLRSPTRVCPWSRPRCPSALRVPDARRPRTRASCSRASTSRASCTRCASA